jgi:hypothetical protein
LELGDNNILFVINSNIKFLDVPARKAVESLNGVNIYDLKVIVGGANKEEDDKDIYYTTYDSCDYTTFNYIVDNPDKFSNYTHIFYMHDTSWVGSEFKNNFVELTPKSQVNGYLLTHYPSMNIGLYNIEYLLYNAHRVKESKNTDNSPESINKWKQWGAQHEDYLNAKNGFYCQPTDEVITFDNPYGTQTPRRTRYFPALDFYKSQSNYEGVKEQMNVEI